LDTFQNAAHCPHCGTTFQMTACPLCGKSSPFGQWYDAGVLTVTPVNNPYAHPASPPM
jgi:RNA polymerase subunit RPABC4/transcription elongation factor Spt4